MAFMAFKFVSAEKRDEMANRLVAFALEMHRARDQGHDGSVFPTDEQIDDVRAAAAVVAASDISEISTNR